MKQITQKPTHTVSLTGALLLLALLVFAAKILVSTTTTLREGINKPKYKIT